MIFVATMIASACARHTTPAAVALPPQTASSASSASSAPPTSTTSILSTPITRDREIAHGVIVDLRARKEIRTLLTDDDVWNDADDGVIAYEHIRADQIKRFKEELRAYDIATGNLVWSRDVGRCYAMTAARAGVFCDSNKNGAIVLYDRTTGNAHTIATPNVPASVSTIEHIGSKVAVTSWFSTEIPFFDDATGAPAGKLAVPSGFHVVQTKADGACGASFDPTSATITCFDASPRVRWSKTIPITKGELRMADDHDVLVTTRLWGSSTAESVVVSLDDGREIARIGSFVSSLVHSTDGRLDGFFRVARPSAFVGLDGRDRWTTTAVSGDSASTVLVGDTLIVASYGRITSGADLVAFDRASGATKWKGDVELLPISHSAYSNEVALRMVGGAIVMRGREAMQDYLELFDPSTGARLYSTVRRR